MSMGFPRQEHWSGVLCPPPADLPDTGIDPKPPMSPASTGGFFTTRPSGKPVTYFTLPSETPLLFVAALLYWNSQVHALLTLSIYLFFFCQLDGKISQWLLILYSFSCIRRQFVFFPLSVSSVNKHEVKVVSGRLDVGSSETRRER